MLDQNISILCWNVRGLNCPERTATVHETIATSSCHLVCLQETKLQVIDPFTAAYLGGQRLKNFAYKQMVLRAASCCCGMKLWSIYPTSSSDHIFSRRLLQSRVLRITNLSSLPPSTGQLEAFTKMLFSLSYHLRSHYQEQSGWLTATSTKYTGLEIKTAQMWIAAA